MDPKTNKPNPIYFSDYFKVDKTKLKELGVFDPILNFDTKLFVDPTLLKSSSSEIFQNARERYVNFFNGLLKLLKCSEHVNDRFWRAAKQRSKFSEYKFTCIGYGNDSINGTGPGHSFSDKLLESAKDIIEAAKNDPEMFLLLPLLEDGMGADGISDMTQSIIDDNICTYTQSIMDALGLTGDIYHTSQNQNNFLLLKNPFSKSVIKLLPQDILADLSLADTFDDWLVKVSEINPVLRQKVNNDIGTSWFEATKKNKKEDLLKALKDDDSFFVEVLKVLKDYTFEAYDVELDHRGLHRWLKDSKPFSELPPVLGQAEDSLEAIHELVQAIVYSFKELIENKNMRGLFWANVQGTYKHVNEFYSQRLFFLVAKTWLEAQHSNVAVSYEKLAETEHYTIKFTVSGSHVVLVQIKHANNTSLQPAFQKHLRYVQGAIGLTSIVAVLNFKYKDTAQFKALKEVRYEDCSLIEISAQLNSTETKEPSMTETCETSDLTFELDTCNDSFIELEDFDWQFDENYTDEKRRGGQKRHRKTTEIKETLIHPMFSNRTLIRGESIKQRAEKINSELSQIPTLSENELELFSKKYGVNLLTLNYASAYFEDDRQAQIYRWCLAFSKEATHAQS